MATVCRSLRALRATRLPTSPRRWGSPQHGGSSSTDASRHRLNGWPNQGSEVDRRWRSLHADNAMAGGTAKLVDEAGSGRDLLLVSITAGPDCRIVGAVETGRWIIGRSPAAHLRVGDPTVELHHVMIDADSDTVRVTQLAGHVPVLLDDVPISVSTRVSLPTRIAMGSTELTIECPTEVGHSMEHGDSGALADRRADPWRREVRRGPCSVPALVLPPSRFAGAVAAGSDSLSARARRGGHRGHGRGGTRRHRRTDDVRPVRTHRGMSHHSAPGVLVPETRGVRTGDGERRRLLIEPASSRNWIGSRQQRVGIISRCTRTYSRVDRGRRARRGSQHGVVASTLHAGR